MPTPKVDHSNTVCCICGSRDTYICQGKPDWRRYYDKNGDWDEKSYTCYNCRLIGPDRHKKYVDEKKKRRKCAICGNTKSRIFSGKEYWTREYDKFGHPYHICYECELEKDRLETKKIREQIINKRVCCTCGSNETYVDNSGRKVWLKYRGDDNKKEWDRKSWLCNKCHKKIISHLPDSLHNLIKLMRDCRSKDIDLRKFSDLTDRQRGDIIEDIVTMAYNINNYNKETDNYSSPFDATHPEYGKLQIKGASFDIKRGIWYINIGDGQDFDILIILCMDSKEPWENVERAYMIPYDFVLDQKSVTITRDSLRGCKWDEFRTDKKIFNDAYHNMEIYINFFKKR